MANIFDSTYDIQNPLGLVERISRLHMVMVAPFYVIPTTHHQATLIHAELADPALRYPRLAHTLLLFLWKLPSDTGAECLYSLVIDLIAVCMARSGHSEPLKQILDAILREEPVAATTVSEFGMAKYFPKLIPSIEEYFDVCLSRYLCSCGYENSLLFYSELD